ncbi:hypothetical protein VP01_3655g4, partial [Puccinia sorghi]
EAIHPVFHVSLLEPAKGLYPGKTHPPPEPVNISGKQVASSMQGYAKENYNIFYVYETWDPMDVPSTITVLRVN